MKRIRTLFVALVVPALILAVFAVSMVFAGGAGKVTVCHFANHKYFAITIGAPAVPAHLRHGDVMPDEYGACP